ncbi:hypothetical protein J3L16_07745 [Alteromonas sp. 5E99-2]|uniref:hypothetical protein n=1 Tax=Alteromonas sp. 5E99-2 TaxID=2817683 RepID=UPI001A980DF0|nr:hypothetical protein [Alteromonas sp. 5E99-2]MBO1255574.1 hypothetical protein [Alteromonas sp. 5E99-2]
MQEWKNNKYYWIIELLGFWEGGVNASNLAQQFSVTRKQGKQYLTRYRALYPQNLIYNTSLKHFIPTSTRLPTRRVSP